MYAVPSPSLPLRCMTCTRCGWRPANPSAISPVPSGELSSTINTYRSAAALRTASTIRSMFSRSLKVGRMTSDCPRRAVAVGSWRALGAVIDTAPFVVTEDTLSRVERFPPPSGGALTPDRAGHHTGRQLFPRAWHGRTLTVEAIGGEITQPLRWRLFRKYVTVLVVLIGGALVTSGALDLYFWYREERSALTRLQQHKATAAAAKIASFVNDTRRQLEWATQPAPLPEPISNAARR